MQKLVRLSSVLGVVASLALAACAADPSTDEPGTNDDGSSEDELRVRGSAAWFYSGALPVLEKPQVTVSLKGHTARVTGLVPAGTTVPELPHVRQTEVNGRIQLDVVYPIATGSTYGKNARPDTYFFDRAVPYRPDGNTFTYSQGNHWVTWGGFPFLAYNGAIALHGPITDTVAKDRSQRVWFLKRGTVSSGCNRMNGEHVIELAHITGVNMRTVYSANQSFRPQNPAKVNLIADYDKFNGKYVDVDFPTDVGVTRPGKTFGNENVEMFGSWVAAELPDGSDLPGDLKWEGGEAGKWYVFKEHATYSDVCSVLPADLTRLKTWAARQPGAKVPADFCKRKDCVLAALADGDDPNAICR